MLAVHLLGVPRLFVGGRPVTAVAPPRTLPLLAYLVLFAGTPIPRKVIAERVWPDAGSDARTALRRHLFYLDTLLATAGLPATILARTSSTIGLRDGALVSDVATIRAVASDGDADRLADAARLYAGDLLEPYDDDWIVAERLRFRAMHRFNLERLVERARAANERDAALRWAAELQRLDPFDEDALRTTMRLRHDGGDTTGALAVYASFTALVRRELDLAPSEETAALASELANQPRTAQNANRLPLELTSFVGRDDEVERLERVLRERRLLTLTGPPGVGKTRLAIRTSKALADDFPDGVWFVDLAPVSPGTDVLALIARTLARGSQTIDLAGAVDDTLRGKHALVVLDNCEHLADACAAAALVALHASDGLRILATSRTPLHVDGETVWHVAPLEPQHAGVDLFLDRAQLARPQARFTDTLPRESVRRLCVALDGLPLAIELAATRLRTMSFNELVDRIGERFIVLRREGATGDPRHHTLLATFAWSYSMLPPGARMLLRRLAAFRGGWTSDAARAIGADLGADARVALGVLVDHSLVLPPHPDAADARYDMLQSTREFALEKLAEAGERGAVRATHAAYVATYVAAARVWADDRNADFDFVERELDNVRAALEYALDERGDVTLGCDLVDRLGPYWVERGRTPEGVRWLRAALDRTPGDERARASLHVFLSRLLTRGGDTGDARAHADRAVALSRAAGAPPELARALLARARAAWLAGDLAGCAADAREAHDCFEPASVAFGRARALGTLYLARISAGDVAAASEFAAEATRIYRLLDTPAELAESLANEGTCAYYRGERDDVQDVFYREAAQLTRFTRSERTKCYILSNYAGLLWRLGRIAEGWTTLDEVFRVAFEIGNVPNVVRSLEVAARGALEADQAFEAAVFTAAAVAGSERYHVPYQPVERADHDALLRRIEEALEVRAYAEARALGAELTLEAAVARVRALAQVFRVTPGPP